MFPKIARHYLKRRPSLDDPLFSGLRENDIVMLNGTMVREIIAPVFEKSLDLLAAVDEWIFESPKKPKE